MKRFKLLTGVFCLVILLSACGGKGSSRFSTPDEVYGKNTETEKTAIASLMVERRHQAHESK